MVIICKQLIIIKQIKHLLGRTNLTAKYITACRPSGRKHGCISYNSLWKDIYPPLLLGISGIWGLPYMLSPLHGVYLFLSSKNFFVLSHLVEDFFLENNFLIQLKCFEQVPINSAPELSGTSWNS